jgi:sterol desaturase/sphingolipid hydroxylase (fatty acid hydroxylase superfamily)
VPKSRVRNRAVYTPPPKRSAKSKPSPRWVLPAMLGCLIIGLIWIALYYITGGTMPGLSALGAWNLAGGFTLIVAGVVLATQWR